MRPAFAIGNARHGIPRLRTIEPYAECAAASASGNLPATSHIGYLIRGAPDEAYLTAQRGVAAFGAAGVRHVLHILADGVHADVGQLAVARPDQSRERVTRT